MDILLSPPIAFLIYIPLVTLMALAGRQIAARGKPSTHKTSAYGSGEEAPSAAAAPGYKPFFLIAFFFAFLHLGMLVLGTGGLNMTTGIYLAGLVIALAALVLG